MSLMPGNNDNEFNTKIAFLLLGVGSAALMISVYHCISMGWCNRNRAQARARPNPQGPRRYVTEITESGTSIENSTAQLIPAYKYEKGMTFVADGGGTCSICLSEFEDGEELRTLPECKHSFHVGCIDMWLRSHNNCPMCRSDATPMPSPQVTLRSQELDGQILQGIIVHSRPMQ